MYGMTLRDLLEKRASLVTEMRTITTAANGDGGDLSAEQATKFDGLKTQIEGIEKQIERQRYVDDAERRMGGEQIAGSGDRNLDAELREYSLRKAICARIPDLAPMVDSGREREISQELAKRNGGFNFQGFAVPTQIFEKRVLVSSSNGADLISTDHLGNQFIDILRARLV